MASISSTVILGFQTFGLSVSGEGKSRKVLRTAEIYKMLFSYFIKLVTQWASDNKINELTSCVR